MIIAGVDDPTEYIKCFERITGNLSEESVSSQMNLLSKYSDGTTLSEIYDLSPDSCIRNQIISGRTKITAKNKSTCLFFKFGSDTKSYAISRVLEYFLKEKFFYTMRSEKGDDYIVYMSRRIIHNSYGISFNVQSDQHVLPKILQFIDESNLEHEDFELIAKIVFQQKNITRNGLVCRYSYFLSMGIEIENREQNVTNSILSLTPDDLKNALKNAEIALVESVEFEELSGQ